MKTDYVELGRQYSPQPYQHSTSPPTPITNRERKPEYERQLEVVKEWREKVAGGKTAGRHFPFLSRV